MGEQDFLNIGLVNVIDPEKHKMFWDKFKNLNGEEAVLFVNKIGLLGYHMCFICGME